MKTDNRIEALWIETEQECEVPRDSQPYPLVIRVWGENFNALQNKKPVSSGPTYPIWWGRKVLLHRGG